MVHTIEGIGLGLPDVEQPSEERIRVLKFICEKKGGTWDAANNVCIPAERKGPTEQPPQPKGPPQVDPKVPEITVDDVTKDVVVKLPNGQVLTDLSKQEAEDLLANFRNKQLPEGTQPVGAAQSQFEQRLEAAGLAGEVGQFDQLPSTPTDPSLAEAGTVGVVSAIPNALRQAVIFGGGAALLGGTGGAVVGGPVGAGIGAGGGAAIGAAAGFASGLASGLLGSMKQQRADLTTAQQRVLDEGKQTLNDWVTLAEADPANRAKYIDNFNEQLAIIDQAYRNMKLDTSRDVAKFETSIPSLAEFKTFYGPNGERDFLIADMRNSLLNVEDETTLYKLTELSNRRGKK